MRYVDNAAAVAGELRKSWGWLLAWGVLIALGVIEIVQAFKHVRWAGFFLFLVGELLSIVTGFMVWYRPLVGMAVITLLMASDFLMLALVARRATAPALPA
jgi:uncharacterized membrane protein HdeD (DUF308 family)